MWLVSDTETPNADLGPKRPTENSRPFILSMRFTYGQLRSCQGALYREAGCICLNSFLSVQGFPGALIGKEGTAQPLLHIKAALFLPQPDLILLAPITQWLTHPL